MPGAATSSHTPSPKRAGVYVQVAPAPIVPDEELLAKSKASEDTFDTV